MKIDFSSVLKDLDGVELVWDKDVKLTLRKCAVEGLQAVIPNDPSDGEVRFKRWCLAKKIFDSGDPVELTIEEAKTIKEFIGKAFTTKIVGPAYSLLENGDGS